MADVEPLRALRYDLSVAGDPADLFTPPYDVIDPQQRAALAARSPYNAVHVDLPEHEDYDLAAELLGEWQERGALVRDEQPALWALTQEYAGPGGERLTRSGFLGRVRIMEYGAGRIRPHERTHPGPKEDRLRLTRATRVNLSPIFALYSDPGGDSWAALAERAAGAPWAEVTDADGTVHRLWRIDDPAAIDRVRAATRDAELLIADGHHRYETARVYAQEIGGEGEHSYVLTCLVRLEDPGMTVFPTHRLLKGLRPEQHEALAGALRDAFDVEELASVEELVPEPGERVAMGYLDGHFKRPFRLTLKDPDRVAAALPDMSEAYRGLDTAVLEALVLKDALGMSEDDISHLRGLGNARDFAEARDGVLSGEWDCGFFMGPIPVERIQAVAAEGENMPPKSTFFFPKVLTGMVFNPLA